MAIKTIPDRHFYKKKKYPIRLIDRIQLSLIWMNDFFVWEFMKQSKENAIFGFVLESVSENNNKSVDQY